MECIEQKLYLIIINNKFFLSGKKENGKGIFNDFLDVDDKYKGKYFRDLPLEAQSQIKNYKIHIIQVKPKIFSKDNVNDAIVATMFAKNSCNNKVCDELLKLRRRFLVNEELLDVWEEFSEDLKIFFNDSDEIRNVLNKGSLADFFSSSFDLLEKDIGKMKQCCSFIIKSLERNLFGSKLEKNKKRVITLNALLKESFLFFLLINKNYLKETQFDLLNNTIEKIKIDKNMHGIQELVVVYNRILTNGFWIGNKWCKINKK